MNEVHPRETELACFGEAESDSQAARQIAEHLRWCADCRSAVADYRWLEAEVEATLATAADAIPVARSRWQAVRENLFAVQRRRAVCGRASAVASVVLVFCLMLSASPIWGTATAAAARTSSPEAVVAPAPHLVVVTGGASTALVTPTPAIAGDDARPAPTPGFVLPPPTPPEPDAN